MFHHVEMGCCPLELGLGVELLPGNQQLFLEQLESPELPNWVTACEQTKEHAALPPAHRSFSAERTVWRASSLHLKKGLPGHLPVALQSWLSL